MHRTGARRVGALDVWAAATVQRRALLRYKHSLVSLRRVLSPLREVFNVFLRRDQSLFSAATLVYFQNVYDHVLRLLDALDTEREMLAAALDAHLAATLQSAQCHDENADGHHGRGGVCGSVLGRGG